MHSYYVGFVMRRPFFVYNLHIITAAEKKHNCIKKPYSVAYRHEDDTMIIECYDGNIFVVKCQ